MMMAEDNFLHTEQKIFCHRISLIHPYEKEFQNNMMHVSEKKLVGV